MKAAVIYKQGDLPQYTDFPEPIAENNNQLLITVIAAAIKQLDKKIASGEHYSSSIDEQNATVIGGDGVCLLEDGSRVFARGITGMMAEKALIDKNQMIKLPLGLDDAVAAALPNAVAGSAMALLFRAKMKGGEIILINGATSFTGKIAVQIAKNYGAKRIIVTGRNDDTLQELLVLGADEIISLNQTEELIVAKLKTIQQTTPIDIVLDYLWGKSASLILSTLKGKGAFTHKLRFVSVGAITGDTIELSSEILRSTDLHISGSGLGSWTETEMNRLFVEILPNMLVLAAQNKLKVDTEKVALADIGKLWNKNMPNGTRLVAMI